MRFVCWHSLEAVDPDIAWNPAEGAGLFNALEGVRIPIGSLRAGCCKVGMEEFPYKAHGHMYHQLVGSAVIVVVRGSQLVAHQNLAQWLTSIPSTALSKCSVFYVRALDSVWIPFGAYPLIIGLPESRIGNDFKILEPKKDKSAPAPAEAIQYALSLCYDNSNDRQKDAALRSYVSALWVQASPYMFKGIKTKASAWEASLHGGLDGVDDE